MKDGATAYLVMRQEDGYGEVFRLSSGERFTLGRAATNRIVLKDELCSREHAEVLFSGDGWMLRDLRSLNGTRLNGTAVDSDGELEPGDEINVGRTRLLFVENMDQLPHLPVEEVGPAEGIAIKKWLGQTRFLTPLPDDDSSDVESTHESQQHGLSRDLSLLYRLALDMGSANSWRDLADTVLSGLLEATPAEVGAVLALSEGGELELIAHQHREVTDGNYHKVSDFVSRDVISRKEAVLAEDVARDRYLRGRESLNEIGATSIICAPVHFDGKVMALIHLYCIDPMKALTGEDLEFSVAVAKQMGTAIHRIQQHDSQSAEIKLLRDQLRVDSELVGESAAIERVESQISRVADTNATVLIRGESGVGKELVARAIHYSSHRKNGPFVCLNCAAITETLLESELFGHEKGAFTGATEKKIGKFEAANNGTIFLDEIGEMSAGTQAKLLRILEGHAFERVGGGAPIHVDVRVVAATNQPLEKNMQDGRFRRDLYYRLQVVQIDVAPLRERGEDVPLLAEHFLNRFVLETGRKIRGFTDAALEAMRNYHWPGNVRELRNVVERGVALGKGPLLDAADIWLSGQESAHPPELRSAAIAYQPQSIQDMEKQHIENTLLHTGWTKSQAAAILGIERSTLDRKLKSYGIKRPAE